MSNYFDEFLEKGEKEPKPKSDNLELKAVLHFIGKKQDKGKPFNPDDYKEFTTITLPPVKKFRDYQKCSPKFKRKY
jgi:hypothetical protein